MWGSRLSTGRRPSQASAQSPGLETAQQRAGGRKPHSPRTHCHLGTKSKRSLLHDYVGTPHLGQDASPEPPLPGLPLSPLPLQCLMFQQTPAERLLHPINKTQMVTPAELTTEDKRLPGRGVSRPAGSSRWLSSGRDAPGFHSRPAPAQPLPLPGLSLRRCSCSHTSLPLWQPPEGPADQMGGKPGVPLPHCSHTLLHNQGCQHHT